GLQHGDRVLSTLAVDQAPPVGNLLTASLLHQVERPDVVEPAETATFTQLSVSPAVVDALAKREINGPFAIQTLVLSDAIEGRDVLARSQTGSGKTLAFPTPVAERLIAPA